MIIATVSPPCRHKSLRTPFSALDGAVVDTVSVEVWGDVPLMVTLNGLRLHVGISLTLVIKVVTAQVRLIDPVNPFVPTTLIVPVFPDVAPGDTEIEVVLPVPEVKLGCGVTLREIVVVAVRVSDVPVIVTVTGLEVT